MARPHDGDAAANGLRANSVPSLSHLWGFPWIGVHPVRTLKYVGARVIWRDESHPERPRRPLRGDEEASRNPMERGGPTGAREEARRPPPARCHAERQQAYGRRRGKCRQVGDRKSTRLNSSHITISYAVFCL